METDKDKLTDIQMLRIAEALARFAHRRQERYSKDETGENFSYPYALHLEQVALTVPYTPANMIVSWLHDIVEDTDITLEILEDFGFTDEIVKAVDVITKRREESYSDYIKRVAKNKTALYVKITDLEDNLKDHPEDKYELRLRKEKYEMALLYLNSVKGKDFLYE